MEIPTTPAPSTPQAAGSSQPSWLKHVAMLTGVLAGLVGFLTVRGNNMLMQANLNSTQAVLHRATASDKWGEYQADSIKKNDAEAAAKLAPNDTTRDSLLADAKVFEKRQPALFQKATDEEAIQIKEMHTSDEKLKIKGYLDYAAMAAQVGIALASVAALTRKKIAYWVGIFAGVAAVAMTGYGLLYPYLSH